ncbi:hypothetical protein GCM10025865_06150 [Paraoerskovia sediminicola]|uniref:Gram-positive cocci surface proteins LPxTG domain-containing protein n=1 Tax=Paraoerskovia sediminicola TaxID=1138587 RepID=A0ABM8G021_9CELL|nr:hypothetical protein [Paraoerskovia sediminicola]BDZ41316.1 hypothetical protein GCM10025865_06150 [Paraoerskovia sediminicola]
MQFRRRIAAIAAASMLAVGVAPALATSAAATTPEWMGTPWGPLLSPAHPGWFVERDDVQPTLASDGLQFTGAAAAAGGINKNVDVPLSDLADVAMSYAITSNIGGSTPSFQIVLDKDPEIEGASGHYYRISWDVGVNGEPATGTYSDLEDGTWTKAGQDPQSLADWSDEFPNAVVKAYSVHQSSNTAGSTSVLTDVTFGDETSTFGGAAIDASLVCTDTAAVHATNLDEQGWSGKGQYAKKGLRFRVPGGWAEKSSSLDLPAGTTLADVARDLDIEAEDTQYVGIKLTTSMGTITYEEAPGYGYSLWSKDAFPELVSSTSFYPAFAPVSEWVYRYGDLEVTKASVLVTSDVQKQNFITGLSFGCTDYTFGKATEVTPTTPTFTDVCNADDTTSNITGRPFPVVKGVTYSEKQTKQGVVVVAVPAGPEFALSDKPSATKNPDRWQWARGDSGASCDDLVVLVAPTADIDDAGVPTVSWGFDLPTGWDFPAEWLADPENDPEHPVDVTFSDDHGNAVTYPSQDLVGSMVWPGWTELEDGTWAPTDTDLAWTTEGTITVTFSVNPGSTATVTYPEGAAAFAVADPAAPAAGDDSTTDTATDTESDTGSATVTSAELVSAETTGSTGSSLAATGASVALYGGIALLLAAAGGAVLFVLRRRQA